MSDAEYGTATPGGGPVATATASDMMSAKPGQPWNDYGVNGCSPQQYGPG